MHERVAILMTCHNRIEKTLTCLQCLYKCDVPDNFEFFVYLVDDGCTDGTGEHVKELYPDVQVIYGTGNLYWSGGMRLAWNEAAKIGYDYYLWLNDDTFLFEHTLLTLASAALETDSRAIICSSTVSKTTGKLSYGGKKKNCNTAIQPNGRLVECDIVCGNVVLIPKAVFEVVGNINEIFTHAIGDLDYGLRAQAEGFKCYVTPIFAGTCESNPSLPRWCRCDVPFLQRISNLYSPLAYAQPWPYFTYNKRHFGLLVALRQWVSMHIRVVFPGCWKS